MNKEGEKPNVVPVNDEPITDRKRKGPNRRQLLGHGIHSGIHFRSSTFWSILLGEQIALSVLNDRAKSYHEPFTIAITKFDGTSVEISNELSC